GPDVPGRRRGENQGTGARDPIEVGPAVLPRLHQENGRDPESPGHTGRSVRDRRRRWAPRGHLRCRQGGRGDPRVHAEVGGGEGGIRTPETLARLLVFKTSAINRSATSPMS